MQEKEDKIVLANVKEKGERCADGYMLTNTVFLDPRQRSLAEKMLKTEPCGVKWLSYGGFEDAERRILMCFPEYMEEYAKEETVSTLDAEDNPLAVIRASLAKGSPKLSHRDYLGSLLGLGIKRETMGDILVRPDGADIIVLKELADFILMNYGKAGRASVSLEQASITDLKLPEIQKKEIRDSVASMRLDNVASSAFGISRSKACEAITRGIVFVNNSLCDKIDKQINEGDKIVMRGKGKAVIKEIGGKSRKDRTYIVIERYV